MSIFGIKGFVSVNVIRPEIVAPCNAGAEAGVSARGAAPRSLPHATITSRALTTEAIARLIVPLLVLGGRTCTQGRQKGCVPTVDVPAELDRTVLVGPGGPIEQVDRDRCGPPPRPARAATRRDSTVDPAGADTRRARSAAESGCSHG